MKGARASVSRCEHERAGLSGDWGAASWPGPTLVLVPRVCHFAVLKRRPLRGRRKFSNRARHTGKARQEETRLALVGMIRLGLRLGRRRRGFCFTMSCVGTAGRVRHLMVGQTRAAREREDDAQGEQPDWHEGPCHCH